MALLDFFKKKKKIEEKQKEEKVEKKEVEKPQKVGPSKTREKRVDLAWKVLKSPHISEKATDLVKKNQYTFRVFPRTNKSEVKKAVEDIYGVDVEDVKVIKISRKRKRRGRIFGWRRGYKKAIVKIKEGQKIEVLPR